MDNETAILESLARVVEYDGGEVMVSARADDSLVLVRVLKKTDQRSPLASIQASRNIDECGMHVVDRSNKFRLWHVGRLALMVLRRKRESVAFGELCTVKVRLPNSDHFEPVRGGNLIYPADITLSRLVGTHREMLGNFFKNAFERDQKTRALSIGKQTGIRKRAQIVRQLYDVELLDREVGFHNSYYLVRRKDEQPITKDDWPKLKEYMEFDLDRLPEPVSGEEDIYLVTHNRGAS